MQYLWGHVTFVHSGDGSGEEGNVVGVPYVGLRFPGLGFGWSWVLEVSSWRVLNFSEHLTSLAPSRGCRTPSARALYVLLRPGSPSSGRFS